jgi:hypothetical protein
MFDTTPKISNDPKHLEEFERIFKHGKYAEVTFVRRKIIARNNLKA